MIKILFLTRSLNRGGSERQLIELVKGMDKSLFSISVVTLYDGGALRPEMEAVEEVRTLSAGKKGRWDIGYFRRLLRIVKSIRPAIVHGYRGVANESALIAGKRCGAKVVWGLRGSDKNFALYNWLTGLSFRTGAWLSRFADLVIVNSENGKNQYIARGYCPTRMMVIPNGIDVIRFRPDSQAAQKLRDQWGIAQGERLIGLVGRLDPVKDHSTFLKAAALLCKEREDVRFICVGDGPADLTRQLREQATALGLDSRLIWAGASTEMPAVYSALDIATSTSTSEGFPNVIGEAMACETPCVVTDAGDSAAIVGQSEQIVVAGDASSVVAGWNYLLNMTDEERQQVGRAARQRIVEDYSTEQLIKTTQAALSNLV